MDLKINKTMTFTGEIVVEGETIKTLSQSFDENGLMSGVVGEYVSNKDVYYSNITECRLKEDEFRNEMRKIEDESLGVILNETKE